ncbi:MAG: hypothetical protein ACXVA9_12160 [Bdellovibrionales bacterium]
MTVILQLLVFAAVTAFAEPGMQAISPSCLPNTTLKTKEVTHYMIPLLDSYQDRVCNVIEGTCIYGKNGVDYLHNVGYPDILLANAHCKNGWGNKHNCLHPCRTLAASMKHHQFGQIVFMKELVGQKCGNLKRDGFEMIHDGYMVVLDTGSPVHFNAVGRFDFFWGRCKNQKGGECFEGAIPISSATTKTDFCTVWDPRNPKVNENIKNALVSQIKAEDHARGDIGAADDFAL